MLTSVHLQVTPAKSVDGALSLSSVYEHPTLNCILTEGRFIKTSENDVSDVICTSYETSKDPLAGLKLSIDFERLEGNYLQYNGPDTDELTEGLWMMAGDEFKKSKTTIESGDFLRFGKQIVQLRIKPASMSYEEHLALIHKDIARVHKVPVERPPVQVRAGTLGRECRFCLENATALNPLLHDLCACTATMPVHPTCLANRLRHITKPQKYRDLLFFDLSCLTCEICKERYPLTIATPIGVRPLLDLSQQLTQHYMTLLILDCHSQKVKSMVLIDLGKKDSLKVTIGKSDANVLRFLHPTVKENHAFLKWKNGVLTLVNTNNDFGSFKRVSGKLSLLDCDENVFWAKNNLYIIHMNSASKQCECPRQNVLFNPLSKEEKKRQVNETFDDGCDARDHQLIQGLSMSKFTDGQKLGDPGRSLLRLQRPRGANLKPIASIDPCRSERDLLSKMPELADERRVPESHRLPRNQVGNIEQKLRQIASNQNLSLNSSSVSKNPFLPALVSKPKISMFLKHKELLSKINDSTGSAHPQDRFQNPRKQLQTSELPYVNL